MFAAQDSPVDFGSRTSRFSLVSGGKGGHKKFRHPKLAGSVILGGNDGDDAKDYQEKQVRTAIREAAK